MSAAAVEELYEKGNIAGRHVAYVGGVHHVCDKAWAAVGGRDKEGGICNPVTSEQGPMEHATFGTWVRHYYHTGCRMVLPNIP